MKNKIKKNIVIINLPEGTLGFDFLIQNLFYAGGYLEFSTYSLGLLKEIV